MKIDGLRTDIQDTLSQEIDAATAKFEAHSQKNHSDNAVKQEQTRTQLLNVITGAASVNDRALYTNTNSLVLRVGRESENTRLEIGNRIAASHDVMKEEISRLQRNLYQLEVEMNTKVEELKELVIKINTTPEDPERQSLNIRGNLATIIIMSLRELYKSLQVNG